MNFHQTIQLKALRVKELHTRGSSFPDQLVDQLLEDAPKEEFRNICAMISVPLFNDVTELCGLLEISKRRFIEMALVEAMRRASEIVDRIDPLSEKEVA
jgi:hypothetical protein